jgi:hypothetical protein
LIWRRIDIRPEFALLGKKPLADIRYLIAAMNPLTPRIRMQEDLIGMSLYAYKWDVIGRNIFKTGTYDPFLSKWLIERFKVGGGGGISSISAPTSAISLVFSVL